MFAMITFCAPLTNRGLIKIAGPETQPFLQGLVTSDLEALPPGEAGFTTLLTPQGKILFEFFVLPQSDGVLLDCFEGIKDALLKRLKLYKLRAAISLEDVTDNYDVSAIYSGPCNASTLPGLASIYLDPRFEALGHRIYTEKNTWSDMDQNSDFTITSEKDYQLHCLQQGIPELGHGFSSEELFLLDVNYDLLRAVSYQKGCFVGQEVSSRMKRKGEIRKRTLLIIAPADGDTILKAGENVTANEVTIGKLLVAKENIGLALIRMDRVKNFDTASFHVEAREVKIEHPAYMTQEPSP